jgi:hypothetical protein
MERDIAVAENVLSTLIKQEFDKRNFFPMEVRGNYMAGYGVTFTIPTSFFGSAFSVGRGDNFVVLDGSPGVYSYSWSDGDREDMEYELAETQRAMKSAEKAEKEASKAGKEKEKAEKEKEKAEKEREQALIETTRVRAPRVAGRVSKVNSDSLQEVANVKIIQAAKNFLTDYGDMLSQLGAEERIVITNRNQGQYYFYGNNSKRSFLSMETTKGDLTQYRQGKLTRDQLLSKINVTNTESSGKVEPDIELLSSIFNRLYSSDLSKTYYMSGHSYYERLTDFGAIVYMQVYSSNQVSDGPTFDMPTVQLRDVDQAARDKKVKELYPVFENELKENILDYGRTVKSLGDNEQLIFKVKLTKCKGCGIPSDIEVSVKTSVLKEYNAAKIDKNIALSKITVKKGAAQ